MNELKNIKATGLSTLGPAIKNVFDVLNINRMQSGMCLNIVVTQAGVFGGTVNGCVVEFLWQPVQCV